MREPAYPPDELQALAGEPRLFFRLRVRVVEELPLNTLGCAVALGLTPNTNLQFDAEASTLDARNWAGLGGGVRGRTSEARGILRAGYRRYSQINVWALLAQLEFEWARDVSLVGAGVYERSLSDGARRIAGGLRTWPLSWLVLEGGWAANGTSAATDHSTRLLAEAMVPWTQTQSRLSVYAGRQPSLMCEAGLRLSASAGGDLRRRDRDMIIRGLR